MAAIVKVRKATWTQPDYKRGFQYDVFYESGRKVRYNWKQCLPTTVVMFLMDAECKTEYKESHIRNLGTVKWETFTAPKAE